MKIITGFVLSVVACSAMAITPPPHAIKFNCLDGKVEPKHIEGGWLLSPSKCTPNNIKLPYTLTMGGKSVWTGKKVLAVFDSNNQSMTGYVYTAETPSALPLGVTIVNLAGGGAIIPDMSQANNGWKKIKGDAKLGGSYECYNNCYFKMKLQ